MSQIFPLQSCSGTSCSSSSAASSSSTSTTTTAFCCVTSGDDDPVSPPVQAGESAYYLQRTTKHWWEWDVELQTWVEINAKELYAGTGDPNGVLTPDDPSQPAQYRWIDNANTILHWDVDSQTWG